MWSQTKYRQLFEARQRRLYRDPSDKLRDAALVMTSGSRMLIYPATMTAEQQLTITREIEKQHTRLTEATKDVALSDKSTRTTYPKSRAKKKSSSSYAGVESLRRRLHSMPENSNMHHYYPLNFSDGLYEYVEYRNTWTLGRRCILVVDETVINDVDVHEGQFSVVVPFHPENDAPETIVALLEQQVSSLLSSLANK